MMEQLKIAAGWLRLYAGDSLQFVLLAAALIYIMIYEKNKVLRRLFAGYTLIFAAVYFCPLTVSVMSRFIGDTVYWRMLWLLPGPFIIAYAMVRQWSQTAKKWKRAGIFLIFTAAICLTGKNVYLQDTPYKKAANLQKVPAEAASVCAVINENREEGEYALVAAPEELAWYIRQYDASIEQVFGRKGGVRAGGSLIKTQLMENKISPERFCQTARDIGCNYIVLTEKKYRVERLKNNGFEVIGQVGNYVIYKDVRA